jgi:hypothetical protein
VKLNEAASTCPAALSANGALVATTVPAQVEPSVTLLSQSIVTLPVGVGDPGWPTTVTKSCTCCPTTTAVTTLCAASWTTVTVLEASCWMVASTTVSE